MTAMSSPDLVVSAPQAGDRSALARNALWVLGAVLLAAMALSLLTGASGASLQRLFVGGSDDPLVARDRLVYFDIRLPRLLLGMLVGSAPRFMAPSATMVSPPAQPLRYLERAVPTMPRPLANNLIGPRRV